MMNRRILTAGLLLSLVWTSIVAGSGVQVAASGNDPEVLLQDALHMEEVEGRLREAIDAYKMVIAKAGSNKRVAATASLHIASVYEKLGRAEARGVYQTIVKDFPDQPSTVALARTRLAALGAGRMQSGATPRRVLEGARPLMFDVSNDGRWVVGPERVGYSGYHIVLRDIVTGQSRILVQGGSERGGFQARFSTDSRRVAHNSWEGTDKSSLRIVDIAGSAVAEIPASANSPLAPVDWSPDSKSVLIVIQRFADPARPQAMTSVDLAWASVETKAVRIIKTFEPWQFPFFTARVSPDGAWIAYTASARAGSPDRYVYVCDADGQNTRALVTTAGRREMVAWSPDSSRLVFDGSAGAGKALWAIKVANGQAAGDPWILQNDFTGDIVGFGASNFYYSLSGGGGNFTYVLSRPVRGGERPTVILGMSTSWSRDGSLALTRYLNNATELIVRHPTGQELSFRKQGLTSTSPRWLPDGSGVIVTVAEVVDGVRTPTFQMVDLRTGSFRRLFNRDTDDHLRTALGALSPDGKTLYLGVRANAASPVSGIVGVDVATGNERPVFTYQQVPLESEAFGIGVSPDGGTLAVAAWSKANAVARIFTVGVDGSNYREVVPSFETGWLGDTIRWSSDGQHLVFVAADTNKNWRLMRVASTGGEPVADGISYDTLGPLLPDLVLFPGNFNNIDLSPDGSRIVVSTLTSGKSELWTLDGLMSVLYSK